MNNELNNEEKVNNSVLEENKFNNVVIEADPSEKKAKKNIVLIIILIIVILLVGIISGFFILKGLNAGVKQSSFMYDILNKSGLIFANSSSEDEDEYASDSDYEYASDSDFSDNLVLIEDKEGRSYYYFINEDGDYLYYYSDSKDIYEYYASDSNGDYLDVDNWYFEEEEDGIVTFITPDFTKMKLEDFLEAVEVDYNNEGSDISVEWYYVPNDAYEKDAIYYQSYKPGQTGYAHNPVIVLINAEGPEERD